MNGFSVPRRWDPFRDFPGDVGRLLESLDPLRNWRSHKPYPSVNVYDTAEHYILTAELPGISPEELELSLTGETLTLRGERKRQEGVSDESYRRQERYFGQWSRSVTLPERVDGSRISAQLDQGILTVTLPKSEEAKPRRIAVTTAPG